MINKIYNFIKQFSKYFKIPMSNLSNGFKIYSFRIVLNFFLEFKFCVDENGHYVLLLKKKKNTVYILTFY